MLAIQQTTTPQIVGPLGAPQLVDDAGDSLGTVLFVLDVASGLASGYHGYKRNHDSVAWGLVWAIFGMTLPVITPIVAVMEGYAEPLSDSGGRKLFAGAGAPALYSRDLRHRRRAGRRR